MRGNRDFLISKKFKKWSFFKWYFLWSWNH
jgi:hypothetical protein